MFVSIALATYNGEKYLKEQLDSLFNQTYSNIEIVVSDDKSTDSTLEILEEYKGRRGFVYSQNNKNLGFVKNFENAIKHCKGDFIALCDQDDIWEPEKIDKLLANIGTCSMICSDATVIDGSGKVVADSLYKLANRSFKYDDQFYFLTYSNFVTGCTVLFRRDLLKHALPFPETMNYHDWWLAIIASLDGGICFLKQNLIKYRSHGENQSATSQSASRAILSKFFEFKRKEKNDLMQTIQFLEYLQKIEILDHNEKKFIKDRLIFYEGLNTVFLHIKSFIIALKHRKYMFANRTKIQRILYSVAALIIKV